MNLQETIRRILREEVTKDKNLYGEKLKVCSTKPMTGFYRDGYCRTGDDDTGSHTVCTRVTEEFLEFTKSMGNNLDMLEPGDKWCLCAKRWEEANKEGVAPEMIKSSTNIKTLDIIDSVEQELDEYARTLKNARRQGSGLRFPKSAIKANPNRFRPYSREQVDETDPKVGTGKKPKDSSRRLYTDENPKDTVSVKFRTKEDIVDTLNKESFKSKPHKRQSQIINLIHQRVRAAYENAKDPETKKRLKRAYDYIETQKEKSKQKTIRLQKESIDKKIKCQCGWSWNLKDGGNDPYTCHKCGHNNSKKYIKEEKEELLNESKFFRRRIDLDEFERLLPLHAQQVFYETASYEQFKYELTLRAVESVLWNEYQLGWEDLPSEDEIKFVSEVSDMFEKKIKQLYKIYRNK